MADQKSTETALHNLFKNPSAILCSSAAAAAAGDGQGQDEREAFLLASLDQISAPLAARMLAQAGLDGRSTTEPFALLDNGCGLGVVAPLLQRTIRPDVLRASTVVCGDYAEKLVEIVQRRIAREGWVSTEARVIDAQDTGLPARSFTHVVANIMFHTVPDSEAALQESIRLLKPGGTLAFTTWHGANQGWTADMCEAFAALPFAAPFRAPAQTTAWGDWADPNWVRETLDACPALDPASVAVDVLAHLSRVRGADDFVRQYEMMLRWVVDAGWSEELRRAHPLAEVKGLLRAFLERKYHGGEWDLTWVSIIASARVKKE